MRIERLKRNFNINVKLVHFPLHPDTPEEGLSIAKLYAGRNLDSEKVYQQMKGRMEAEGLPYGKRTHTYNSRRAQELGKWADTQENGEPRHDALYRAYFVDTKNIFGEKIVYAKSVTDALDKSHCAIIMVYWKQFDSLNNNSIKHMNKKFIIDCRRVLARKVLDAEYHAIGLGQKI